MKNTAKKDDLLLSLGLIAFAIWYYLQILHLRSAMPAVDAFGPDLFPTLLTYALALLGGALFVQSLRSREPIARPEKLAYAAAGAVLLVAYLIALPRAGFLYSTPVFSVALMAVAGCRKPRSLIAVPILLTGIIYFVFRYLLLVPLP